MAANECIPYFDAGEDVSVRAEAAVTGKRFVKVSDPQDGPANMGLDPAATGGRIVVSHCPAGEKPFGVASYDAAINGHLYAIRGQKIVPVTAGASITAGQQVEVGTNGQAIPLASGVAVGLAVDSAANGTDCPIALY